MMPLLPNIYNHSRPSEPHDRDSHEENGFLRFSFSRRNSSTSSKHQDHEQHPEQQSEPHHIEPQHARRHSLNLHLNLSTLATKVLSPNAYLSPSPTHEQRFDDYDVAPTERRCSKDTGKGKGIMRSDSVDVVRGERRKDGLKDGAPLCREAEIGKWRLNTVSRYVPGQQRWALYTF